MIRQYKMEIDRTTNDDDGLTNYVLVNLDDSEMMTKAKFKPPGHWEFLKEILDRIIDDDDHSLTETEAINLRNRISGNPSIKPPNLETAEQLINEWVQNHILSRDEDGLLSLGFVGIAEFRHLLEVRLENAFCLVCKVTCLRGRKCLSCSKVMHRTCYTRFVQGLQGSSSTQSEIKCPSCKHCFG